MNRCRAPKIPPLLVDNVFVLNCVEKAELFNDFFSKQCTPIINSSVLPTINFLTDKRIDYISIQNEEIISLILNLNPNKASGSDGISGQMLLLCDNSLVLPLKMIFQNILNTSTYSGIWKLANVTPIFKNTNKQLIKNYRPISLLPICGKLFENIIFNNVYSYHNVNNLITKNQSGFRPEVSTTTQLLYPINEIHGTFEDPKSLEVRAVFLDISKVFDKVWHEGLIFKLKQNGISGRLLKFLGSYLCNRKQRVVLNGYYSDYSDIESGVPLAPLGLSLNNLMEKERIQYQADLAITGTWQGSNRTKLYEELWWELLSDRRMSRRILQIHKIIDRKTLEYLRVKFPPHRRLFLPTIFRNIKCRTNRYSNSFFPDAIASWNNMITQLRAFSNFR